MQNMFVCFKHCEVEFSYVIYIRLFQVRLCSLDSLILLQ